MNSTIKKEYLIPVPTSKLEDLREISTATLNFLSNFSNIAHSTRYFSMREYADLHHRLLTLIESAQPPSGRVAYSEIEGIRNIFAYLQRKNYTVGTDNFSAFDVYLEYSFQFFSRWCKVHSDFVANLKKN